MTDFSKPCLACADGRHVECVEGVCGCIVEHANDDDTMRGFKRLKRVLHPDRAAWTKGGFDAAH